MPKKSNRISARNTKKRTRRKVVKIPSRFNRKSLLIFGLIFGALGAFYIIQSYAASPNAALGIGTKNPVPGSVSGRDYMGISTGGNIQFESASLINDRLDKMKQAGTRWMRMDFDWETIQNNGPTSYNWSAYDNMVNQANNRGIKVLATIDYTPAWANPTGGSKFSPPANLNDYANFTRTAVQRYKSKGVHAWEIWNEPNQGQQFWVPMAQPAVYANMLKLTYPVIKQADSSALVVMGGLAPCGRYGTWCGGRENPINFLEDLYKNGAHGYFDAVAWHPYCATYPAGTPTVWCAWDQMYGTNPSALSLMQQNGDGNKKIWMTEYGLATGGNSPSRSSDEKTQGEIVTAAYHFLKTCSFCGPLFWLDDRDPLVQDPNIPDNWFGLRRGDGSIKPSYLIYAAEGNSLASTGGDLTKPTISLVQPNTNITLTGTTSLGATAWDNAGGSGIDYVDFWTNEKFIGRGIPFGNNGYVLTWDSVQFQKTNALPDGSYFLFAMAYDKAGNYQSSNIYGVTLKNGL